MLVVDHIQYFYACIFIFLNTIDLVIKIKFKKMNDSKV